MALFNVTYVVTPNLTGGNIVVSGNTETEIKNAVAAQLTARLNTQNANAAAIQAALDAVNS